jgi:hypothetical protein
VLFNSLNLKLEFCQIGFEFFDLLSLGLEAALEVMSTSTAITSTATAALTLTSTVLAVTRFIVTHDILLFQILSAHIKRTR